MAGPTALTAFSIGTQIFGSAQSAAAYGAAGNAAISAAQYNSKLIDRNLSRQLDSIGSDVRTFVSTQRAQIAASGVSVTSKSALTLANETLTNFEKEVVIAKENATLQKNQQIFQAKQQQKALKSQGISSLLLGVTGAGLDVSSLLGSLR